MGRRLIRALVALVVAALLGAATAHAFPSEYEWRTIETGHFRVTYHQGLQTLALELAKVAEHIYAETTALYEYEPRAKTEIVLVDHVDSPNGFVNVYPYNRMILYAVPPDRRSTLNDYDDWLRVLFAHEFTHIVQLDVKSGLPLAVNMIFGGLVHPNQYMPRWYTEGAAVFDESRYTSAGRERSSLFEMFIRADALEGEFLEIDQINDSPRRWPHGHIPYLYGAKFVQYVADKYGDKTLAAFAYLYGQRLIPYSLNTVMRKVTGDTYLRLYDEWKTQTIARYKADAERLTALGVTPLTYLTQGGEQHDSAQLFPTGDRVLYYHDDAQPNRSGWSILDLKTKQWRLAVEADEDGGATLSPDGRRIVFGQMTPSNTDFNYFELYVHDLDRNATARMTTGMRLREPSFAPDGERLACVQYAPGRARLMILDADSGKAYAPLPVAAFDQIFSPTWSPDGRWIAFTGWRREGFKDLYLYDLETNRLRRLTNDRAIDYNSTWSPDGRTIYWTSDRTGVYNAYAYDVETGAVRQLTNVLGGVFGPMATPDGKALIVASYRAHGFDLAEVDLLAAPPRPAPAAPELRPFRLHAPQPVAYEDREYSPFPSLYPKLWKPTMGEDYAGATLGVSTWGDDISGEHSWTAEVDMGVESGDPTVALAYANRSFLPNLSLSATHVSYTLQDSAVRDGELIDQDESRSSGAMTISFPFRGRETNGFQSLAYSHRFSLGAYFRYTRNLTRVDYEPTQKPPVFAETGLGSGLSLTWNYQNREFGQGFVGSADGRSLYVTMRADTELFGSDVNSISAVAGWSEFVPMPFIDGHSLAFKFIGGVGATQYANRQIFYIGGPPERDLVEDIVRDNRVFGDFIRGYEPLSIAGDKFVLSNIEYRFVIWDIERGMYTLPLYFQRLHLAPFVDTGWAWTGGLSPSDVKVGVGGEIRLDFVMGYQRLTTIRLGYQNGLMEGGVSSLFLALDNLF
ncbi:MAG: hypothetical protein C4523_09615 [Myxococcales bacterium]|nr:MAG: hypothetical protein C4523_09615 [Myxococcales bacterium]